VEVRSVKVRMRSDIEFDSLSDNGGAFRATDAQTLSARVFS